MQECVVKVSNQVDIIASLQIRTNNYFELIKTVWKLFLFDSFTNAKALRHEKCLLIVVCDLEKLGLNLFPLVKEGICLRIINRYDACSARKKNFTKQEHIIHFFFPTSNDCNPNLVTRVALLGLLP